MKEYLPLFGRMGLALIFVLLGLEKALNLDETSELILKKGIPFPTFLVISAIVIEVLGGLLIVIGLKTQSVSLIMAIYLILITFLFYPFWKDVSQIEPFLKNLSIIGGLLTLAYHGAGSKSIDSVHLW